MDIWALFVAHMLAAHLSIPEPVTLKVVPGPLGFDGYHAKYEAVIDRPSRFSPWVIRYDQEAFASASPARVRFVLVHELCHAIYEWNTDWGKIDRKEQERRHGIVNACAKQALKAHKECDR